MRLSIAVGPGYHCVCVYGAWHNYYVVAYIQGVKARIDCCMVTSYIVSINAIKSYAAAHMHH